MRWRLRAWSRSRSTPCANGSRNVKCVCHGRVDDRQPGAVEAQLARPIEQSLAVEGDARGRVVEPREEMSRPSRLRRSARSPCRRASAPPACRASPRPTRPSRPAGRCCARGPRPPSPGRGRRHGGCAPSRRWMPASSCASTAAGRGGRHVGRLQRAARGVSAHAGRVRHVVHHVTAGAAHCPRWNGSSALAAWSGGRCGVTWQMRMGKSALPRGGACSTGRGTRGTSAASPPTRRSRRRGSGRAGRRTRRVPARSDCRGCRPR